MLFASHWMTSDRRLNDISNECAGEAGSKTLDFVIAKRMADVSMRESCPPRMQPRSAARTFSVVVRADRWSAAVSFALVAPEASAAAPG